MIRWWHRPLAASGAVASMVGCSQPAPTAERARVPETAPSAPSTDPAASAGAGDDVPTSLPAPATTTTEAPPTTLRVTTTSTVVLAPAVVLTVPLPEDEGAEDEWTARDAATARVSWYGDESGSHTANGERFDPSGLTFAHLSMPFGTQVRFCGPLGCVVATCTDRGPASWTGKTFDLSRGAFARVAPLSAGVATVTWERVG
jgi:rare lipoprotein A (peptidoglycan hydrolase)